MSNGVVVVGAGPAGLCAAAALIKVGIPALVLEQRGEMSREGAAIALWANAMRALDAIDIGSTIRREFEGLDHVQLCRNNGEVLRRFSFSECAGGPHELIGVERSRLQQILYDALPDGTVILDAPVAGVDASSARPVIELKDGRSITCRAVLAADGVRSTIARTIGVPSANFSGQAGYRGLADLPSDATIRPRTVCQIWGVGNRAGLYPMANGRAYWFVTFDSPSELPKRSAAEMKADALSIVKDWHHGIAQCVEHTPDTGITCNRFLDRWPRPFGRVAIGSVTLAGDAFHPVTPDLGQGGCMALEDGIVLARELKSAWSGDDVALRDALSRYESARVKRCLPISVRSRGIGTVLQSSLPPVVFARDNIVRRVLDISHFFDHTLYDCGTLH